MIDRYIDRLIDVYKYIDHKINLVVQSAASKCEPWRDLSDKITGLLSAIKIVAEKNVSQNLVNKIPDEEEIEQLRTMIELLKKFEELSNLASAENEVSIVHVIPKFFDLEDKLHYI